MQTFIIYTYNHFLIPLVLCNEKILSSFSPSCQAAQEGAGIMGLESEAPITISLRVQISVWRSSL